MKPTVVASKNMKAFLDSKKRPTRVIGPIERHLLTRPFDERSMDVLHPSDFIKPEFCELAAYHALAGNYVEVRDKANLRLQSIFDEGHAIHAKWQKYLYEMGVLYGSFKCITCGTRVNNVLSPEACWKCAGPMEYAEVTLSSKAHMIVGHTDGWVKDLGEDFLIEIKSLGPGTFRMEAPGLLYAAEGNVEAAFKNIKQPFNTHFLQGQVYLHLCHLMVEEGLLESAPETIVFIYELKLNQDYKEFEVGYDPTYVEQFFDTALDIVWAVAQGKPPVCNIDSVKGCKRCAPFQGGNDE
jgi:hypothetical protein